MIKIKRGLDLPITGAPTQSIENGPEVRSIALVGDDYVGMKPTMAVQQGDRVKKGQLLFTDKKSDGVCYTAAASGIVSSIHRGEKRVFESLVIEIDGDEKADLPKFSEQELRNLDKDAVIQALASTGLWTALRSRPYNGVPQLDAIAQNIFVTAIDTNPLAAEPGAIVRAAQPAFELGLDILAKLTTGKLYCCSAAGVSLGKGRANNIVHEQFAGPHPAGLPGTHMHFLAPVNPNKPAWFINYQDVIAIANTLTSGELDVDRVISLAGPQVENPRLIRTRLGADTKDITAGQLKNGESRIVSGSVLGGRTAQGTKSYLGRYHQQVSVLLEGREREMLHYIRPGGDRHSVLGAFISSFMGAKLFNFTTSSNGSPRAMVPMGSYEKIMPLDILPTQLLRALIMGDIETAEQLGALELDEEDLALCTYVCPGKYEYGPILRDNLTRLEKEG